MRYTPGDIKDHIQEIKLANPLELMTLDGEEYVGYYHIIEEEKWTGDQRTEESKLLIDYNSDENWVDYTNLNDFYLLLKYKGPLPYFPKLEEKDYNRGYFTRYFIKKRNDTWWPIMEVDKKQYDSLNKSETGLNEKYYFGILLDWKITGPLRDVYEGLNIVQYGILDSNYRMVMNKEKEMYNISQALRDYSEYAKV